MNDDIRMLWCELAVKDFAESDEWKEKRLKLKTEETNILKNINIMTGMSKKLNE